MAVPAPATDNGVVYQVVSEGEKYISSITVSTEIQSSVANGPYLMASIAPDLKGPWTPLYIQRVGKA